MAREWTTRGRIAERYELVDRIGRGGMGTVWRARDELLEREVAVKQVELPAWLPDQEQASLRARVLREARAAARMSHPASVTVFDVIEDHQSTYIVMELIEAATLTELVEEHGPLPPERAARIGLEVLGALEAAHGLGIVHRDVKPSNIMVSADGSVKLADFGIASVRDHPAITSTGQLVGSPGYMSPEQAEGQASGPGADLWGLGATLYYAVEGAPPFEREGAIATLTAVVNEDPVPPAKAGPLADAIVGLLAKAPEQRPSGPELRSQLEAVAAGRAGAPAGAVADSAEEAPAATAVVPEPVAELEPEPEAAPPPPPPAATRAAQPLARRERSLLPAAALALVLVVFAIVVWAAADDDDEQAGQDAGTPPSSTVGTAPPTTARRVAPTTPLASVPAGWVQYTDRATGYRIAHPPGWQVRPLDRTRTDFTDPATGSYLRVDWTDRPGDSPEGDWQRLSRSFGARHQGYRELRIEPTTYKGYRAAIWEYSYSSGAARLHAVDLGMITGRYGFALNFQTPEGIWEQSQPTFESFKAAFQPPE